MDPRLGVPECQRMSVYAFHRESKLSYLQVLNLISSTSIKILECSGKRVYRNPRPFDQTFVHFEKVDGNRYPRLRWGGGEEAM